MQVGRSEKSYIAAVEDADGVTYEYVYVSRARRRRDAEDEARASVTGWGGTLVGITPAPGDRGESRARRLLVVAAATFALSSITIGAMMIIGLKLEGAL